MLPPEHSRLFLSIPLPRPCQEALGALAEPMRGIRWVPSEQIHLTLRFLGEIGEALALDMEDELAKVGVEPFLLPIESVGAFPAKGTAKVLWAGVGQGHTRLFQLRQLVDDALLAAGWRGSEINTFEPHLTLGRVDGAAQSAIAQWIRTHRDYAGPPFWVNEFTLVTSELGRGAAVHEVRRTFPLAAPSS